MTDEQMNRLIHEKILGKCCHEIRAARSTIPSTQGRICTKCRKGWLRYGENASKPDRMPPYATDLNAVALAEAEVIEAKGIQHLFACLSKLVETPEIVAFACPEERAEACLRAMDLWEVDNSG